VPNFSSGSVMHVLNWRQCNPDAGNVDGAGCAHGVNAVHWCSKRCTHVVYGVPGVSGKGFVDDGAWCRWSSGAGRL
jgi:hypothetical protein